MDELLPGMQTITMPGKGMQTYPIKDHEAEVELHGAGGVGVLDGHGPGVPTEVVLLLVHGHPRAAAPRQLVRRRQPAHAAAHHRHSHPGLGLST